MRPRIAAPNPNKGREMAQASDENVRVSIESNQIREREVLEVTSMSNVCNRLQKLSVLTILSVTLLWSDRGEGPRERARRASKMTSVEEMENDG